MYTKALAPAAFKAWNPDKTGWFCDDGVYHWSSFRHETGSYRPLATTMPQAMPGCSWGWPLEEVLNLHLQVKGAHFFCEKLSDVKDQDEMDIELSPYISELPPEPLVVSAPDPPTPPPARTPVEVACAESAEQAEALLPPVPDEVEPPSRIEIAAPASTLAEETIIFNSKQNSWLSNFHPARIGGYRTLEHAYQAKKILFLTGETADFGAYGPLMAKHHGRKLCSGIDATEWNRVNVNVMRALLAEKFSDAKLASDLINTGSAVLAEATSDEFWGLGNSGSGRNVLGHLLMSLRTSLVEKQPEETPPRRLGPMEGCPACVLNDVRKPLPVPNPGETSWKIEPVVAMKCEHALRIELDTCTEDNFKEMHKTAAKNLQQRSLPFEGTVKGYLGVAGSGKTTNILKHINKKAVVVTPFKRLSREYKAKGFKAYTCFTFMAAPVKQYDQILLDEVFKMDVSVLRYAASLTSDLWIVGDPMQGGPGAEKKPPAVPSEIIGRLPRLATSYSVPADVAAYLSGTRGYNIRTASKVVHSVNWTSKEPPKDQEVVCFTTRSENANPKWTTAAKVQGTRVKHLNLHIENSATHLIHGAPELLLVALTRATVSTTIYCSREMIEGIYWPRFKHICQRGTAGGMGGDPYSEKHPTLGTLQFQQLGVYYQLTDVRHRGLPDFRLASLEAKPPEPARPQEVYSAASSSLAKRDKRKGTKHQLAQYHQLSPKGKAPKGPWRNTGSAATGL
jgi:hypothetical protein